MAALLAKSLIWWLRTIGAMAIFMVSLAAETSCGHASGGAVAVKGCLASLISRVAEMLDA